MSLFNSPHIAGWPGHNAISHAAGWTNQLAKRGRGGHHVGDATRADAEMGEGSRGRGKMDKERVRVIKLLGAGHRRAGKVN